MISLSIYEDALNTCYKEYKSNNNIFKWDGNSYEISNKLIGAVYNYRIFPIMSCIGIGLSGLIKMDNIVLLIIIRAFCGLITALIYKKITLYLFSKELNKSIKPA